MKSGQEQRLREELQQMISKSCWSVVAGEGTGSVITINIGEKVRRPKPVRNLWLNKDEQENEGEMSLMIWCAWRLDGPAGVVCGSTDSNDNDGSMVKGVKMLIGRVVESAEILSPAFDLRLAFRGQYVLNIFCDQTSERDGTENYTFYGNEKILTVEAGSCLAVEQRER